MQQPLCETFVESYRRAVYLIADPFGAAIIRAMLAGKDRFPEIAAAIPDIDDCTLSERLMELEDEGIVTLTVMPEIPVRVVCSLSNKGRALAGIVTAVSEWAAAYDGYRGAAVLQRG